MGFSSAYSASELPFLQPVAIPDRAFAAVVGHFEILCQFEASVGQASSHNPQNMQRDVS